MRCVLLLLVCCGQAVRAQPVGDPAFTVRKFGIDDGLLHRRVLQAAQDRDGYLWLATQAGVQRFDGYAFKAFTTAEGLTTNAVSGIWCDGDGLLWITSSSMGSEGHLSSIDILDPRTFAVNSFAAHFGNAAPCKAGAISDRLCLAPDGSLVLAGDHQLIRYLDRARGFSIQRVEHEGMLQPVMACADGSTWCIVFTPRLLYLPLVHVGAGGAVTPLEGGDFRIGALAPLGPWNMLDVAEQGLYFIASREGGEPHEYWLTAAGQLQEIPAALGADQLERFKGLLREPLGDDLWLVDGTVCRMHAGDDPLAAPVLFDLATYFPDIRLRLISALRDRRGSVWLCGEFGLYQLRMRSSHFQRFLYSPSIPLGYGLRVRGIVVRNGRAYVNTEFDGEFTLDANTGRVLAADSLTGDLRYAMLADEQGGYWRAVDRRIQYERDGAVIGKPIEGDRLVWSMLPVGHDSLLLGTPRGLAWASLSSRQFHSFGSEQDDALAAASVPFLFRSSEGAIWACTTAGLYELDPSGRLIARWHSGDRDHYLPADDFRHVYEDAHGIFCVSTATSGLLRWDRRSGAVRAVTRDQGLPCNSIYAVYPDDAGRLWMPTDNGIVCYDPANGSVHTYNVHDGIAHNEFNRLSHTRGPDGRLYFGGMNGITVFDPNAFTATDPGTAAPLVIKAVQQFDGGADAVVDRTLAVNSGEPITVHPGDRFFNLELALLGFERPEEILYAWRVDGIDQDWNQQVQPQLRFASLPYGTHLLRIKARGADGIWSVPELHIRVIVLTPWYLKWWVITLVVLLVAASVVGLFRYRLARARELLAVRNRIALDLHDEVGSTLSSVALFSTVVNQRAKGRSAEETSLLARIAENSAMAMESMNDIVWSVNTRYDKLDDVIDRMRAFAEPLAEAHGCSLHFQVDKHVGGLKLGMNERKDLYLIFKEAVNNAVRHAHCSRILVSLGRREDVLAMRVEDDGMGMPAHANGSGSLGGNGLGNMRRRAEALQGTLAFTSAVGGGTVVELAFIPLAG